MSKWRLLDSPALHDPVTGVPYGLVGADGQEYSFPALAAAQSGTFAQLMALTGMADGDSFYVTSGAGMFKSWWTYDATSGLWTPVGRRLRFASAIGADATNSPGYTDWAGAAGTNVMILTGGSLVIPAGMLRAGCRVRQTSVIERPAGSGAAAFNFQWRIGTANGGSDRSFGAIAVGTVAGNAYRFDQDVWVRSATTLMTTNFVNPTNPGTVTEENTFFNVASAMYFTAFAGGASVTTAERFRLHGYSIDIEFGA